MRTLVTMFAATGIVATATSAFAASKQGLNSFNIGNSTVGAKGTYSITVENRSNYAKSDLTATGDVRFLGKTARGIEFTSSVLNSNGKKTASYSLSIAGFTVDSGTKTASYRWSKSCPRTLLSGSSTFVVSAVPVTVSGSLGANASVGMGMELATTSVALSGSASANLTGQASAGVGVKLLNLSLKSTLALGKRSVDAGVNVTPTKMSGSASLAYDPVSIDLGLVLQTMKKEWGRVNLAQYSAPRTTISLLKL